MKQSFITKIAGIPEESIHNITKIDELSYELKIKDVMTADVKTVRPDMPMASVMELFRQRRISGAPVVYSDSLVGIVSIEDLILCLQKGELNTLVEQYMSREVITVNEFDPVIKALEKFTQTRVGRLPVVNSEQKLVGILTKGDITRGLLNTLRTHLEEEEVRRYRASHLFQDIVSDRTSLILRYYIKPRDFTHGGVASSHIKRALLRLGATPKLARRCGIAVYEAEMNLIIHTTEGGHIRVEIEPHQIWIRVSDSGPGIENVELALQPGFSTASEEIREMGFGAGMGLVNIKRCVDRMYLKSSPGKGTQLEMNIDIKEIGEQE